MAEPSARERVAAATDALREQAQSRLIDRASIVESAVIALLEGRLDDTERVAAERAAHKIAGSAGTFGFRRASGVARELENILAARPHRGPVGPRAAALIEDLHAALMHSEQPDPTSQPAQSNVLAGNDGLPAEPIVLVMNPGAGHAAAVARGVVVRGLHAEVTSDVEMAWDFLQRQAAPVAAVVQISGTGLDVDTCRLICELDRRGTVVVGLIPPAADTTTRVAVLRAGARLLLDAPEIEAAAVLVADAVASLVLAREHVVSRVLAVDDDETVLLAVQDLLDDGITCEVETLGDPERFWAVLGRFTPDLVILDIDMPQVTGLELCKLLRSDPRWNQLPVVFLSGAADETSIRQVYASGADDFVLKPVVGPELRARVANRLERTRLHRLLAETDPLTGLANRRRLERDLERLETLCERYGTALSVAVVDLDHFKRVNDLHGHALGDQVLRRLATHLREAFRGEDTVARIGGEEFVVAMLGMRREDAVERLRGVLETFGAIEHEGESGSFTVGASAGVAQHQRDGVGFQALYRAADGALRVAKAAGRGRVLPAGVEHDTGVEEIDDVDVAIVEDDEVLAELLRHTLTAAGYRCAVLTDGLEAIRRLTDPSNPLRPVAVLLDIDLPGRSGYEVLHALQQAGITNRTAVVVLTARSTENEAMRALRGGATDHIAKPFSVPMLVQKMHRLIPRRP